MPPISPHVTAVSDLTGCDVASGTVQFSGPLLDLYLHYCSVGLGSPSSAVRAACVGMLGPLLLRTSESMGVFLSTMRKMAEEVRESQALGVAL